MRGEAGDIGAIMACINHVWLGEQKAANQRRIPGAVASSIS